MKTLYIFLIISVLTTNLIASLDKNSMNIIFESSDSNEDAQNKQEKYHSIDNSSSFEKNDKYSAKKEYERIKEILKNTDIHNDFNEENNIFDSILQHISGIKVIKKDERLKSTILKFTQNHFNCFRALFIIPDEKNVLNNLQKTLITNLSTENLISSITQLEDTDHCLQLWIFTQLMSTYLNHCYKNNENQNGTEKEIRNAIIDLGKKINAIEQPQTNQINKTKKGIDYVELIFKGLKFIDKLPNANQDSKAFTTLIGDMQINLKKYNNTIKQIQSQKKTNNILTITNTYINYAQTTYATKYESITKELNNIYKEITKNKDVKKSFISLKISMIIFISFYGGLFGKHIISKIQNLSIVKKLHSLNLLKNQN